MPVQIHAIRHVESEMNLHPDIVCGRSDDVGITDHGEIEQIPAVADYLGALGLLPDLVISSPATRAFMTGKLALMYAGIRTDIQIDDRIAEMSQGEFEGHSKLKVYHDRTGERLKMDRLGIDYAAPGGQSRREVGQNMHDAFMEAAARATQDNPNATILAFTHGMAIGSLEGRVLGLSNQQMYERRVRDDGSPAIPNGSDSLFIVEDGEMRVEYVGRTEVPTE